MSPGSTGTLSRLGGHVFSIAMRTRFRGITVREGMLLRKTQMQIIGVGDWQPAAMQQVSLPLVGRG